MFIAQCFDFSFMQSRRVRSRVDSRELKQQRFWATHVNRKWPFFIFWRWFRANFQSNRLYNSKEAKEYKFYQGFLRGKIPHFRLTCVAQKRRCLSSLLVINSAHYSAYRVYFDGFICLRAGTCGNSVKRFVLHRYCSIFWSKTHLGWTGEGRE